MSAYRDAVDAICAGKTADQVESSTIEFKQEPETLRQTLDLLSDAVICLANAQGGTIIVGVSDHRRGPDAILGVSPALSVETLIRGIFARTRPGLSVPVTEHLEDGKRLLEITVPRGATFYANSKGTATRRIGSSCEPFPPEQQRQALASRGLYDWSAQPSGTNKYSSEEMGRLRRLLRSGGRDELAARDDLSILQDLRLVDSDGELNNAGLLLIGDREDIQKFAPNYGYSYQYRESPGTEALARSRERRALLAAIEHLIDLINARQRITPLNVAGGLQLNLVDYPSDAVRELVVNALVHRDYEVAGSVDIEQSPTYLRITNPGGLVFGVTAENILSHPSTPRNTRLLEVITGLKIAERSGQGIDRAYRVLLQNGKQPPVFTDSASLVEVDVAGGTGNDAFVKYVKTGLDQELASDIEVLLTLDLLCAQKQINAQSLAPLIQRSNARAQATLERLAHQGILEPSVRTATKPFPNYRLSGTALAGLNTAVAYHRHSTSGIDAKIVSHLKEYGYITNQTVRLLFDVDTSNARDILADLQLREVIVKAPGNRRGPGVKYLLHDRLK